MVQVIQLSNPQGKLSEMLGMSLGEGLGQGISTFYANKAIDDVINDKSLSNAPISAKMGRLQSALAPYGERGQQLFQQRMQIEAQAEQEKQQATQQKQSDIIGRMLNGKPVTDKERGMLSPEQNLAIAKHQQAIEIQNLKNQKPPKPTQASQPIDPDQLNRIQQVRANPEFADASPSRKYQMLTDAGVSRENSQAESEITATENKVKTAQEKAANQEDIKFHEESRKYADKVEHEAETATRQLDIIEDLEKDIDKIKPGSLANLFRGMGTIGEKISNALLSKSQAKLMSAVPEFLEGRKELFGVRLSDADLRLLQDKLPDIGKNATANKQILDLMKKYAHRAVMKKEASQKILQEHGVKKRGGFLRPLNYESLVNKEFNKMLEEEKGVFDEMPPAAQYKGRKLKNNETGEILESNGKTWEKQKAGLIFE